MTVHTLQMNMTRGEATPFVHARVDTDHYQSSLKRLRNGVVLRYGGVQRLPGTIHMGENALADLGSVGPGERARWLSFKFNRIQVYGIEVTASKFRFWNAAGRVETGPGVPYEVAHTYGFADLDYLQSRQVGDVLYITCLGHRPKLLTRISETNWTFANYVPLDGPYLDVNETATTLTPANRNSLTPFMTTNTAPSGTASSDTGSASAFQVFDGNPGTDYAVVATSGWLQYRTAGAAQVVVENYWITATDGANVNRSPTAWVFEGSNDGVTYVTIDSRVGESGWSGGETRFYETLNKVPYEYHRFRWTAVDGSGSSQFAELGMNRAVASQTAFNLTASSTTGINGGTGFQTSDVGRPIRLKGNDGRWRWAPIISRPSTTVVTVKIEGHALPSLAPITSWRLGAWSDYTGWPACIGLYEDRLVFARTNTDILGGWTSVVSDYDNFRVSTPVVDDDAITFRLTGGELNEIMWLVDDVNIICGTAGSIRAVGRNDQSKAFAPGNIRQRKQTIVPVSHVLPIQVESMILFMDAYQQRVYEAVFSYEQDSYIARELSALNEHLFATGIDRMVYQSTPQKTLWCVTSTGTLVAATYDREEKVFGAGLGNFGGVIDDMIVLPGETGDDVLVMVNRTINGLPQYCVEKLAEFYREDYSILGVPIYSDCSHIHQGSAVNTITAPHLANEAVGVWADGVDFRGLVASGTGVITLPSGITATEIVAGLRRTFEVGTLPLPEIGSRDGSALGRKKRIIAGRVSILETCALDCSAGGEMDPLQFEDDAENDPLDPRPVRTGVYAMPVDSTWDRDGEFSIQTDSMYPATIRAISLAVEGEP